MSDIVDDEAWLIVKRDLYYRPDGCGYTGIRDEAGRYSYEDAKAQECKVKGGNNISIVKLTEAPEFTDACYSDLARDHLKKQLAERDETIRSLRSRVEWSTDFLNAPHDAEILLHDARTNTTLVAEFDADAGNDYAWATLDGPAYHIQWPTHWMPLPPPPLQDVEGER